MIEEVDLSLMNPVLQKYRGQEDALITILQEIQETYGYLPESVLRRLSSETKISMSRIFAIATFYAQFYLNRRGKNIIRVCRGTACHFKGAPSIIDSIRSHLRLQPGKETTEDFFFSLEEVACLGACGIAPVMTIDEETYGNRTPASALEVINQFEAAEKVAEEVPAEVAEEKKAA